MSSKCNRFRQIDLKHAPICLLFHHHNISFITLVYIINTLTTFRITTISTFSITTLFVIRAHP